MEGFDWDFVSVTTGTEEWGTPHTHIYVWADDPEDALEVSDFQGVIDRHVDHCAGAEHSDHLSDPDGKAGAITIRSDPQPTTEHPAQREATTRGALYVASQLPHLTLSRQDPDPPAIEAAVTAWADSHNWFSASRGI
jgi:hypothetical protein